MGDGDRQGEAQHGQEHDPHGGAEVAAVDGGGEHSHHEQRGPGARVGCAAVEDAPQRRLRREQGGRPQDEPGDHVVEGRRGGREEEQGAGDPARQGHRRQPGQTAGLITDLPAVAGGGGQVAGPDPHGVGDVGRESRIPECQEDRERDQAATPRHAVEDAGTDPGQHDQHDVGRGHRGQEYGTGGGPPWCGTPLRTPPVPVTRVPASGLFRCRAQGSRRSPVPLASTVEATVASVGTARGHR